MLLKFFDTLVEVYEALRNMEFKINVGGLNFYRF